LIAFQGLSASHVCAEVVELEFRAHCLVVVAFARSSRDGGWLVREKRNQVRK